MLLLGAISVFAIRLLIPWTGAWVAECDLDLSSDQPLPTGAQVLTVGTGTLKGTIDPRGTGRFGEKASARLVAGGGGWNTTLQPFHFHNDAAQGVTTAMVLQATAKDCGEVVNVPAPARMGADYIRLTGPAARVLEGLQWYVDANGITQIASWPAIAAGADVDVIERNPAQRRIVLAADEVVWPGTQITDIKFGTITVRDVEQLFSAKEGSRVAIYTSDVAQTRLGTAVRAIANLAQPQWLRTYTYAVQSTGVDGRLYLQALSKADGIPDTLPISVWGGIPGLTTKTIYAPGTQVHVRFVNGNPAQPVVESFDPTPPTELHIDAATLIELGAGATSFASQATIVDANFTATKTLASAIGTVLGSLVPASGVTALQVSQFATALATFLAAVAPTPAAKVKVL